MTLAAILIALSPALFAGAAVSDLLTYKIPNLINGAIIVLFALLAAAMAAAGKPLGPGEAGWHLLAGIAGLAAGMGLFAVKAAGGGDAKLFAAASLWLGWQHLLDYVLLSALIGGALTLFILMFRSIVLPPALAAVPAVARLADPKNGVPYGVALAGAALVLLPQTELFRNAAVP